MGCSLHQHGHGHSHGVSHSNNVETGETHIQGSHGHTHDAKEQKENINVKAALMHVVGDFQRRFQVIFTALIIY